MALHDEGRPQLVVIKCPFPDECDGPTLVAFTVNRSVNGAFLNQYLYPNNVVTVRQLSIF